MEFQSKISVLISLDKTTGTWFILTGIPLHVANLVIRARWGVVSLWGRQMARASITCPPPPHLHNYLQAVAAALEEENGGQED